MDKAEKEQLAEENIPLLENVVNPEEIDFDLAEVKESPAQAPLLPQIHQTVREVVTTELYNELSPIVSSAIEAAVQQATKQIRLVLKDELEGSLEYRLRTLIKEAVGNELATLKKDLPKE